MGRSLRSILGALVVVLAAGPGCLCKKTDEERLRDKLDSTPTYLYLAVKTALHPNAKDDDARAARKLLRTLVVAGRKGEIDAQALEAKDAASLALTLWKLRGLGKDAVRTWKTDPPPPVLAPLLDESGKLEPALATLLDAPTEHAVLLAGFTVLKVHPKLAVPIPEEILLYEARYADPDNLSIGGLASTVHALRAYTFGNTGLCDLAATDAKAVDSDAGKGFGKASKALAGVELDLGGDRGKSLSGALTVLASGSTAICYAQRGEPKKSIEHLRKLLDAADDLGLASDSTELLRGLVECADGQEKKGRAILREVRDATKDASTKKRAEDLIDHCDPSVLGVARLGGAIGLLAFDHLVRSRILDDLADTPLVGAVAGLGGAATSALDKVKAEVPDANAVKKRFFGGW